MPRTAADYRPRDAEHAVLYRVIDEHLDAIRAILATLALLEEQADRAPPFAPSLDTSHAAAIGA